MILTSYCLQIPGITHWRGTVHTWIKATQEQTQQLLILNIIDGNLQTGKLREQNQGEVKRKTGIGFNISWVKESRYDITKRRKERKF